MSYRKPRQNNRLRYSNDFSHVPPVVYQGLSSSPSHQKLYEPQSSIPIDSSDPLIRSLSPFRIRFIPPAIFDYTVPDYVKPRVNVDPLYFYEEPVEDNGGDLTSNFSWDDFLQGREADNNIKNNVKYVSENMEMIKKGVENYIGQSASVSILNGGGYRPPDVNEDSGGAEGSQHLYGKAVDVRFQTNNGDYVDPNVVRSVILSMMNDGQIEKGGVGIYGPTSKRAQGFVHYDVRGNIARWEDSSYTDPSYGGASPIKGISVSDVSINKKPTFGGSTSREPPFIYKSSGAPSDITLFESAMKNYDTYNELLVNRNRNAINSLGDTSYDRDVVERYIAYGKELYSSGKINNEPGGIDRFVAVDVINQLIEMINAPPLTLLINPETMTVSYEKIQQFSQRTRYEYIFQSWGESQPVITFSGKIGAFLAGGLGQDGVPSGVQFASKRDSASYQNLMNLLTFYRNNGNIFDRISGNISPYFVGSLAIEYDQWVYVGNFNSMSWGYDTDNQNGGLTFDMEFTVIQAFDNHESSDIILPMSVGGSYKKHSPELNTMENMSLPNPRVEAVDTSAFKNVSVAADDAERPSIPGRSYSF